MNAIRWASSLSLTAVSASADAQIAVRHGYRELIDSREAVRAMEPLLLGDAVNFYTGELSFE